MNRKLKEILTVVTALVLIVGTVSTFKWGLPCFPDPMPMTPGFVLHTFSFLH